jgi:S1-C subfamily serine protease
MTSDSSGFKAGLEIGDVITELAGHKVFTPEDFKSLVEQLPADRSYPVKILRDGKAMILEIQPTVR